MHGRWAVGHRGSGKEIAGVAYRPPAASRAAASRRRSNKLGEIAFCIAWAGHLQARAHGASSNRHMARARQKAARVAWAVRKIIRLCGRKHAKARRVLIVNRRKLLINRRPHHLVHFRDGRRCAA